MFSYRIDDIYQLCPQLVVLHDGVVVVRRVQIQSVDLVEGVLPT